MVNPPPVLNQLTWGVHLNFEKFLASPPTSPDWLTPLQQQDWQRQGLVVWDVELRLVAHLYAGHALEVLKHMRATEEWKTSGFLIGSPTYQLSINRTTEQLPQTAIGIIIEIGKLSEFWLSGNRRDFAVCRRKICAFSETTPISGGITATPKEAEFLCRRSS